MLYSDKNVLIVLSLLWSSSIWSTSILLISAPKSMNFLARAQSGNDMDRGVLFPWVGSSSSVWFRATLIIFSSSSWRCATSKSKMSWSLFSAILWNMFFPDILKSQSIFRSGHPRISRHIWMSLAQIATCSALGLSFAPFIIAPAFRRYFTTYMWCRLMAVYSGLHSGGSTSAPPSTKIFAAFASSSISTKTHRGVYPFSLATLTVAPFSINSCSRTWFSRA